MIYWSVFWLIFISFIITLLLIILLEIYRENRYPNVGSCLSSRFGCCADGRTYKLDQNGTNCVPKYYHCHNTAFGCCFYPGWIAKKNNHGSNCWRA